MVFPRGGSFLLGGGEESESSSSSSDSDSDIEKDEKISSVLFMQVKPYSLADVGAFSKLNPVS